MRYILFIILGMILGLSIGGFHNPLALADHSGAGIYDYNPSQELGRSQRHQELNDTLQRGPYTAPYSPYTAPSFNRPC